MLGFTQRGGQVGTTVTVEETISSGAKEFKLEIEIPAGSLQIGTGGIHQLLPANLPLRGLSREPSQTPRRGCVTLSSSQRINQPAVISPSLEPGWDLKLTPTCP